MKFLNPILDTIDKLSYSAEQSPMTCRIINTLGVTSVLLLIVMAFYCLRSLLGASS